MERGKGKYFIEGSLRLDQTFAKPAEDHRLDARVNLCAHELVNEIYYTHDAYYTNDAKFTTQMLYDY